MNGKKSGPFVSMNSASIGFPGAAWMQGATGAHLWMFPVLLSTSISKWGPFVSSPHHFPFITFPSSFPMAHSAVGEDSPYGCLCPVTGFSKSFCFTLVKWRLLVLPHTWPFFPSWAHGKVKLSSLSYSWVGPCDLFWQKIGMEMALNWFRAVWTEACTDQSPTPICMLKS